MSDVVEVFTPGSIVTEIIGPDRSGLVEVVAGGLPTLLEITAPAATLVEVVTPGPSGPKGDVGEQGDRGETGPSPAFEQHFADAATVWTIHHPLDAYPVTTTVDLNGEEIVGDVATSDKSTVVVTFGLPIAGTARLKA